MSRSWADVKAGWSVGWRDLQKTALDRWGEAIRRGYRYCGTKKIEQGKAREHYDEFRRYIDFARGKIRLQQGQHSLSG